MALIAETSNDDQARFLEILENLAHDQQLTNDVTERVVRSVPDYGQVPHHDLVQSVVRNRALAIRTLRSGAAPRADDIWEAEHATRQRLEQKVQIEDIMRGFREVLKELQRRVIEDTQRADLRPEIALQASTLLWDLGDSFSTRIARVYRDIRIEHEVTRYREREARIHRFLSGRISAEEVAIEREEHGVREPVRAVVTGVLPRPTTGDLPDSMVFSDGRAVGYADITSKLPADLEYSEGPPVTLDELHESHEVALQLQNAAEFVGLRGRHTLSSVSWRIAVPHFPQLNSYLHARYIQPVKEFGEFGDAILTSVAAYLSNDLKAKPAADCLPIHENTLRYRLKKFETITHMSFDRYAHIMEVDWAIAALGETSHVHRAE
jgi:putative transposase